MTTVGTMNAMATAKRISIGTDAAGDVATNRPVTFKQFDADQRTSDMRFRRIGTAKAAAWAGPPTAEICSFRQMPRVAAASAATATLVGSTVMGASRLRGGIKP